MDNGEDSDLDDDLVPPDSSDMISTRSTSRQMSRNVFDPSHNYINRVRPTTAATTANISFAPSCSNGIGHTANSRGNFEYICDFWEIPMANIHENDVNCVAICERCMRLCDRAQVEPGTNQSNWICADCRQDAIQRPWRQVSLPADQSSFKAPKQYNINAFETNLKIEGVGMNIQVPAQIVKSIAGKGPFVVEGADGVARTDKATKTTNFSITILDTQKISKPVRSAAFVAPKNNDGASSSIGVVGNHLDVADSYNYSTDRAVVPPTASSTDEEQHGMEPIVANFLPTQHEPIDLSSNSHGLQIRVPTDVREWTVQQVQEYFSHFETVDLASQEIDGAALLQLTRPDVINNLKLKLGPALRLYGRILELQKSNGGIPPQS